MIQLNYMNQQQINNVLYQLLSNSNIPINIRLHYEICDNNNNNMSSLNTFNGMNTMNQLLLPLNQTNYNLTPLQNNVNLQLLPLYNNNCLYENVDAFHN